MADIKTWIGTFGGDWSDAADWSTGSTPDAASSVFIDGSDAFVVTVSASQAASDVALENAAATLDIAGALAIGTSLTLDDGTVVVTGSLSAASILLAGGTLDLAGTIAATTLTGTQTAQIVTGDAALDAVSDLGTAAVLSSATLTLDQGRFQSGTLAGLQNHGLVVIAGGTEIVVTLDNTGGTLVAERGTSLAITGTSTLTLAALGDIATGGGTVSVASTIDLGGSTVSGSRFSALSGTLFLTDGTLSANTPGLDLVATNATVLTNGQSITLGGANSVFVISGTGEAFTTLAGSTIEGILNTPVSVEGGLTVMAGTLGGPGTIASLVNFLDGSQTLDDVTVLGPVSLETGGSLTLGPGVQLANSGTGGLNAGGAYFVDGSFTNQGSIDIGGGVFEIDANGFANSGTIDAVHSTLDILMATTAESYAGAQEEVTTSLTSGFPNGGVLQVSSATSLELDGIFTRASLGTIDGTDATLVILPGVPPTTPTSVRYDGIPWGTLDLQGGTLDIGEGQSFNELDLRGVVENGVVQVGSGGFIEYDGGTLENAAVETAPCFAAGTRIATSSGLVPVEALAAGDLARTADGAARPIRWIGRRSYEGFRIANDRLILPIVIRAGALADGIPLRDLAVSPRHALFLDGVLIPAELLVNGLSVMQPAHVANLTYFHLELDAHDILLAEGVPSESFIDHDSRMMFQNAVEFLALHPMPPLMTDCARRVEDGEQLERVRRRIAARAGLGADHVADAAVEGSLDGRVDTIDEQGVSGWAFDPTRPHTPIWLEVFDGKRVIGEVLANRFRPDLLQAGKGAGRCSYNFSFAKAPGHLRRIRVRRTSDGATLPPSVEEGIAA